VGLLFLMIALAWGVSVYRGYDTRAGVVRLPLIGMDVKVEETGMEEFEDE
jgi:hypothetical protein